MVSSFEATLKCPQQIVSRLEAGYIGRICRDHFDRCSAFYAPFLLELILTRLQSIHQRIGTVVRTAFSKNDAIGLMLVKSIFEQVRDTTVIKLIRVIALHRVSLVMFLYLSDNFHFVTHYGKESNVES